MTAGNPDGLVISIAAIAIILFTFIWKKIVKKDSKITFDQTEKLLIYFIVLVLVLYAGYLVLIA